MGPTRSRRLVERLGDIGALFKASLTELEATGIMAVSAQSIGTAGASWQAAEEEIARSRSAGAAIVCIDDLAYPARLKEIYDPPVVLYVRGPVDVLSEPGIAIIGTRHPTPYGIGMAERLACDLARQGLVIFSGLAGAWTALDIVVQ